MIFDFSVGLHIYMPPDMLIDIAIMRRGALRRRYEIRCAAHMTALSERP